MIRIEDRRTPGPTQSSRAGADERVSLAGSEAGMMPADGAGYQGRTDAWGWSVGLRLVGRLGPDGRPGGRDWGAAQGSLRGAGAAGDEAIGSGMASRRSCREFPMRDPIATGAAAPSR